MLFQQLWIKLIELKIVISLVMVMKWNFKSSMSVIEYKSICSSNVEHYWLHLEVCHLATTILNLYTTYAISWMHKCKNMYWSVVVMKFRSSYNISTFQQLVFSKSKRLCLYVYRTETWYEFALQIKTLILFKVKQYYVFPKLS